jgi:sarcosine oxidase
MAKLALPLWRQLEAEAGVELLTTTGQLTFGPGIQVLAAALSHAGAPAEVLPAHEVERIFPAVAAPGPAVFEPDSGMLHAARCLEVGRRGVEGVLREGVKVHRINAGEGRTSVVTSEGTIRASVVVCCAGAWSAPLLATAGIKWPLVPTLEQVAYLAIRPTVAAAMPVIVDRNEPALYGLPTPDASIFKVGRHHAGVPSPPETADLSPDPATDRELGRAAAEILPGLDPRPIHSERCFYDNSPEHDFVLDRAGPVTVGAGTSGHGFKFGPLLGHVIADLATGSTPRVPVDWLRATRFG